MFDPMRSSLPLLVCITPHVPFDGVTHAGGAYLQKHLSTLNAEIAIVSFNTPDNQLALAKCQYPVTLIGTRDETFFVHRQVSRVERAIRPWAPRKDIRRAFHENLALRNLLWRADLIELHWPETLGLFTSVQRAARSPIVMIPHDLLSSRFERQARSTTSIVRTFQAIVLGSMVRQKERSIYPRFDSILSFSTTEAKALFELNSSTVVVRPPLELPDYPEVGRIRGLVLFAGALDRSVNDEAARRLVCEIWPDVRRVVPSAKLKIVGSSPSAGLQKMIAEDCSVTLKSNVPTIHPFYREASAFVAPLVRGAGVKFKCIEALLGGCRVISTDVGAEGINPDYFFGIANENFELATLIIGAIRSEDSSFSERTAQSEEVRLQYSREQYERQIHEIYAGLLDD